MGIRIIIFAILPALWYHLDMKTVQKDKLIGKTFWIALIVAVVLVGGLLGVLLPERTEGRVAIVYVGGDKVAQLDLDSDVVKVSSYNDVVLSYGQGKVTILECKGGRMCRHDEQTISRAGESIVCPNSQVVVEVQR